MGGVSRHARESTFSALQVFASSGQGFERMSLKQRAKKRNSKMINANLP